MALEPGTRLGPYEITSQLGAGGMGEVYRAHHTALRRDVAIKIVPAALASDPVALARFHTEAQAVAALSHPNILGIFDIGNDAGAPYAVMELLDGRTLRDTLQTSGASVLPPRKAIDYAVQMAAGLAAAHARGITHRDLKPENVFITRDGRVKILDFGLAKVAAPAASGSFDTTFIPTSAGTVLGTVGYMSPEQVRGQAVDSRSDIFSFGLVLYEMLTGSRPFAGASPVETMSAILKEEPPEFSPSLQVPPGLDRIVRRCVEKDPETRFQSARDLGFALDALSGSGSSPERVLTPVRTMAWRPWIALAAALVVGVAIGAALLARRPASPPEVMHFAIPVPGEVGQLALSTDGTQLAFVTPDEATGNNVLHVQRVGDRRARLLPGTEGASYPFWSPDGNFVAFFANGKLMKVPAAGGPVQTIVSATLAARGGSWSSQNVIVYAPQAGGPLWRVNADGTGTAVATDGVFAADETSHRWPVFLPDGDRLVYWGGHFSKDGAKSGIYLYSLAAGQKTLLVEAWSNPGYTADGHLLYLDEQNRLTMRAFDVDAKKVIGDPRVIAESVGFLPSVYWGSFTVSANGTVVSSPTAAGALSALTWFDRAGKSLGTVGTPATMYNPAPSPDGRQIAVDISDTKTANVDVWMLDVESSARRRFSFGLQEEATPVWSPDGIRVAYQASETGAMLKIAGGGEPERPIIPLPSRDANVVPNAWTRDQQQLITTILNGQDPARLFITKVGDPKPTRLLATSRNETNGQLSPDGQWLAYASDESGEWNVYVTTFPTPTGKWQASVGGGTEPRWRGDGKELYYLDAKRTLTAVPITTSGGFSSGTPQPLFRVRGRPQISNTDLFSYDVTRDGSRFIVNTFVRPASVPPLEIVIDATAPSR
jgi:Tol biopolymer transport system component